jgi:hypothetical protein
MNKEWFEIQKKIWEDILKEIKYMRRDIKELLKQLKRY